MINRGLIRAWIDPINLNKITTSLYTEGSKSIGRDTLKIGGWRDRF